MKLKMALAIIAVCYASSIPCVVEILYVHPINMHICMGDLLQYRGRIATSNWSAFLLGHLILFAGTLSIYAVLLIRLKLYSNKIQLQTTNSGSNPAIVLTLKALGEVTILYFVSFLCPFISIIVKYMGIQPSLSTVQHYLDLYQALIFIQASGAPFTLIYRSQPMRKQAKIIFKKIRCYLKSNTIVPSPANT